MENEEGGEIVTPSGDAVATEEKVAEGDAVVAAIAVASDDEIKQDIDELSQADAALATWMGELDEKTDRNAEELKGIREWATQFQTAVDAGLGALKEAVTSLLQRTEPKSETPPKKEETSSPTEEPKEEERAAPKEEKKPEGQKVPLMDENAGARRKRIGWI